MSAVLPWVARGVGALAVVVLVASFTPLPNRLARALEPAPQRRPADAIVVLGGSAHRDGTPGPDSLVRLVEGLQLYNAGFAPLIVLSGGRDVPGRLAAAILLGVPREAFLTVGGTDTTRDEARLVARLLRPRGARQILLVSDGQHLVRASGLFAREGLEVLPVPANVVGVADGNPERRLLLVRSVMEQLAGRAYNAMRELP